MISFVYQPVILRKIKSELQIGEMKARLIMFIFYSDMPVTVSMINASIGNGKPAPKYIDAESRVREALEEMIEDKLVETTTHPGVKFYFLSQYGLDMVVQIQRIYMASVPDKYKASFL